MPFGRRRTAHSKVYPLYFSPIPDDADEGLFEVRTRLIDQVERFVSQTGLLTVRPLDVVLADHALHLEWKKLGFVPHEFAGSGLEAPFQVVVGEVTPAMVLDVLALVAHEALLAACPPPPDAEHTADRLCERRLRVQLHSHGPPTPMSDLRADKIGKLVTVVGSVIRVSSLRPYVSSIGFLCPRCGHTMERCLVDGKYVPPDGCERGGCRVKHLLPDRTTAKTRDFQKVRLQEVPEENLSEFYGRVPRTVEVELLDTLVDTCVPGDIVSVTGIVKSVEVANEGGGFAGGRSSKPKCMYLLYLEAVSLTNTRAAAPAAVHISPRPRPHLARISRAPRGGRRRRRRGGRGRRRGRRRARARGLLAARHAGDRAVARQLRGATLRLAHRLDVPHHLRPRGGQGGADPRPLRRHAQVAGPFP